MRKDKVLKGWMEKQTRNSMGSLPKKTLTSRTSERGPSNHLLASPSLKPLSLASRSRPLNRGASHFSLSATLSPSVRTAAAEKEVAEISAPVFNDSSSVKGAVKDEEFDRVMKEVFDKQVKILNGLAEEKNKENELAKKQVRLEEEAKNSLIQKNERLKEDTIFKQTEIERLRKENASLATKEKKLLELVELLKSEISSFQVQAVVTA